MPLGKSLNTHSDGFFACQKSDHLVQNVGNHSKTLSTLIKIRRLDSQML